MNSWFTIAPSRHSSKCRTKMNSSASFQSQGTSKFSLHRKMLHDKPKKWNSQFTATLGENFSKCQTTKWSLHSSRISTRLEIGDEAPKIWNSQFTIGNTLYQKMGYGISGLRFSGAEVGILIFLLLSGIDSQRRHGN
jgi:hypothetical protein